MKKWVLLALVAALAIWGVATGFSCSCGNDKGKPQGFADSAVWDDGMAEVTAYEAEFPIHGKPRKYEATYIVVKEDLDAEMLVKADPPLDKRVLLPVFKLNMVQTIPTPNYPYHYLTSVFVSRQYPRKLVKIAGSSQEWSGTSFQIVTVGAEPAYEYHTYFDGMARGKVELDLEDGDLFEDALPVALRALKFDDGDEFEARVWPSVISNRRVEMKPVPTKFEVSEEKVKVPAGLFEAWKVTATSERGVSTYWFDPAGTHVLVKAETADGRRLMMKETKRDRYWVLHE